MGHFLVLSKAHQQETGLQTQEPALQPGHVGKSALRGLAQPMCYNASPHNYVILSRKLMLPAKRCCYCLRVFRHLFSNNYKFQCAFLIVFSEMLLDYSYGVDVKTDKAMSSYIHLSLK